MEENKNWFSKHIFMFTFKFVDVDKNTSVEVKRVLELLTKKSARWKYIKHSCDTKELSQYKIDTFYYGNDKHGCMQSFPNPSLLLSGQFQLRCLCESK